MRAFFLLSIWVALWVSCRNKPANPEQQGFAAETPVTTTPEAPSNLASDTSAAPDLRSAKRVLDQLFEAGGDYRRRPPKLALSATAEFLASFHPRSNTIVLEHKALELARSFGKDSLQVLAFILGHELTHFYQKETTRASNFLAFGHNQGAEIHLEKQADLQGVFLAFVAGFKKINTLMPDIVERIYTLYDLKDKTLSDYPSFPERQQTAAELRLRADSLFHVYEAANYLMGLGQYEAAQTAFWYLETWFPGYEVYNNLGVCQALQAMAVGGKRVDSLVYPFEIDWSSRLERARADRLTPAEKAQREQLLQTAAGHFEKALALYPKYAAARSNLICMATLQGNPAGALAMLEQYGGLFDRPRYNLLKGLALHAQGQPARALFFPLAEDGNVDLALLNEAILSGAAPQPVDCPWQAGASLPDQVKPRDLRMAGGLPVGNGAFLQWKKTAHTQVYVWQQGGSRLAVQIVRSPKVPGAPAGARIGGLFERKTRWVPVSISRNQLLWRAANCPVLVVQDAQFLVKEWAVLLPV